MFLFTKIVAVVFIDEATGRPISTSRMPLDRLPDTFARDTELNLGGSHYVVVRANPQTKAEFAQTRKLAVRLRRVEKSTP